ncbi:hypothetical protein [Promicromonospora soli]
MTDGGIVTDELDSSWVDRLAHSVGLVASRREADWSEVEAALRLVLPRDFKDLVEVFGGGVISRAFIVYTIGTADPYSIVDRWRALESAYRANPYSRPKYHPYELYRHGSAGLLEWGSSTAGDRFYWYVDPDSEAPWPIVANSPDEPQFYEFEMAASEFVWRVACDTDFEKFGVARHIYPPTFLDSSGNVHVSD